MQETQETQVLSLDGEGSLEEGMEAHSVILSWTIPRERGAWWATVHRVTKSWTQLKQLSMHTHWINGWMKEKVSENIDKQLL